MKRETQIRIENFVRRNAFSILAIGVGTAVLITTKMKSPGIESADLTDDELRLMEEFSDAMEAFMEDWWTANLKK